MTHVLKVQRSKRRWGIFGAGCSFLVMIPFAFFVLIAGLIAIGSGGVGGVFAFLVMMLLLGALGYIIFKNFKRASDANQEMKVISEKMEAQGGSISVSLGDSAGGVTQVQHQAHDLSMADEVSFDFKSSDDQAGVREEASVQQDKA